MPDQLDKHVHRRYDSESTLPRVLFVHCAHDFIAYNYSNQCYFFFYPSIGDFFTESPPFDLEGAYSDSTSSKPLIFILSPGADPTDYLLQLAASKGKEGSGLRIISLGQGQGTVHIAVVFFSFAHVH